MKASAIQARIIHGKAQSKGASPVFSTTRLKRNASSLPTWTAAAAGGGAETPIEPEFFRQAFELVPDAALVVDRSGKILRMNKQSELMFGYRREVLLGRSMRVLLPNFREFRHRKHNMSSVPRGSTSAPLGREVQGRRSDGAEFPAEVLWNRVRVGSKELVLIVARDITEQKRLGGERNKLVHDLGERVKELATLQALRGLLREANSAPPKLLETRVFTSCCSRSRPNSVSSSRE